MLGLRLDQQLGGGEPMRSEAADEVVGKPHGMKGESIRSVDGRVELPASHEVRWGIPEDERSLVETLGQPVRRVSSCPESCLHVTLVQLGKFAQRADPEPSEQVGEYGKAEHLDREVAEPLPRRTTRHDHAFARGESCRERPVGDPHPARRLRGCSSGRGGDGGDGRTRGATDLLGKRGLPAEVTSGSSSR